MAKIDTLQDNWDNNTISANWTPSNVTRVVAANQELEITNPANDTTYYSLTSASTYDLTASYAYCKLVDAGNQTLASIECYPIYLKADASNQLFWIIFNGTLRAYKKVAGVTTSLFSTTYNSTNHKWFRIYEAGGTVYFDYSANGVIWTNATSLATPITITALTQDFLLGTYALEASATTAKFDFFNLPETIFSDTVTVTESVSLTLISFPSVFDSVTVAENTSVNTVNVISVNDAITVTESVSVDTVNVISVNDAITVTENTTILIQTLVPSVFDTITTTENLSINAIILISVFDSATVTENVSILIPILVPSVFDSITVTENAVLAPILVPSVFDSVTATENTSVNTVNIINVFDTATIIENTLFTIVNNIQVNDAVTVTENTTLNIPTNLQIVAGSYVGDGTDNRNITLSKSFAVKMIWIHATTTDAVNPSASVGMFSVNPAVDAGFPMFQNDTLKTNVIQSLGTGTFQVGNGNATYDVNKTGYTYYYVAFGGDAAEITTGSYTGNATDNRAITGIGFQPEIVFIAGDGNNFKVARFGNTGDTTNFLGNAGEISNVIQSLDANGFTIGTNTSVNTNLETYYYCAIRGVPGQVKTGSYTGNGVDNRSITGVGFTPGVVMVKDQGTQFPVWRSRANTGDDTSPVEYNTANFANGIQAFESDGFQVGTDLRVNLNTAVYYYLAIADTTVLPNVNDTITVSESVTLNIVSLVGVNDTVTLTENVALIPTLVPSVFDTVTVSENVSISAINIISVFDTTSISENVNLVVAIQFSVNDSSTVTENIAIIFDKYLLSVSDTTTVTESFIVDTVSVGSQRLEMRPRAYVGENTGLSIGGGL